jgi:hypothetical protein
VLIRDGTAALPAISFLTDPDTGFYRSAANTFSFATGGAVRLDLTSGGLAGNAGDAGEIRNSNASDTVPTFIPRRASTNTGIGAQAAGNVSLIAGGAEAVRINSATNALQCPGTTSMGWTPVNAANQACNTTCTNACVFGMNTGALGNFVDCADATADTCICAGAN